MLIFLYCFKCYAIIFYSSQSSSLIQLKYVLAHVLLVIFYYIFIIEFVLDISLNLFKIEIKFVETYISK